MREPTVCPKSLGQFYIVSYNMNWVKTSWTHSIYLYMPRGSKIDWIVKFEKNCIKVNMTKEIHLALLPAISAVSDKLAHGRIVFGEHLQHRRQVNLNHLLWDILHIHDISV